MYSIDITLKLSPIPISVQRKEEVAADALYQTIINAMRSPNPELLELTCEKQTDKKVAVLSDQISAVIVSQKSGAASTGRAPGFVALATE
ncbi:MAG: hypothetical protein IM473_02310 [Microcystis sp. M015S2]|uniref:hypothetical protein n=1 Tax=unclassified Microcystis TaxID=2643300 RepID=UPI0025853182|nr:MULTISPECIES: hypothetical protein [unclassified Microcystis]MCA2656063.1 hypothetical protein [Microcystis sp. M061S2]MCA2710484.1 hypothetical protein [Microcystis sp. M025S2]MCA2741275.1 hypothetical protein [Microcystis sp. M015S2]MCA2758441.1 hypothetical protein [Microcystis sp. M145S2]